MNISIAVDRPETPPGDLAIWIFITAELLVFAVFFASYAFTRASHVELFNQWQSLLDGNLALINTLLLITGSYLVVRALGAMRNSQPGIGLQWLLAAILTGLLFLLVKGWEYSHLYQQGYNMRSNLFFMFYFSLTFFHFLHVIMALIILSANAVKLRAGHYSANNMTGLETGASYWHMVDLVWIILFPLVYVMR